MVRAQRAGVVVGEDVPLSWLRSSDSGRDAACRRVAVRGVRVGGGAQALARCLLVGTGPPWPGPAAVALSAEKDRVGRVMPKRLIGDSIGSESGYVAR